MNTEKLFWSIFKAEDETVLHEIIKRDKLLSGNNNRFPYGVRFPAADRNDSFSTVSNRPSLNATKY